MPNYQRAIRKDGSLASVRVDCKNNAPSTLVFVIAKSTSGTAEVLLIFFTHF